MSQSTNKQLDHFANPSINRTSYDDLTPIMHDADLPAVTSEAKPPHVQYEPVNMLPPGNIPYYRAVFLIANAALGAGLLNFPQAYMKAGGPATAITVQFVSSCLIWRLGSFF